MMNATMKVLGKSLLFLVLLQSADVVHAEYCNGYICSYGCCGTSCCSYTYYSYSSTTEVSAGVIAGSVIGCLLFIGSIIGCIVCCVRGCCCWRPTPVVHVQQGALTAVVNTSTTVTAGGVHPSPQPQQFPMTAANNPQAASPYPPQPTAPTNPAFFPQQPPAYTEKY